MRPIFEEELGKLKFYSSEDNVFLEKRQRDHLFFQYFSNEASCSTSGHIYAQKPRDGFESVDVISFMDVGFLFGEPKKIEGLLFALENIVERAGIERVTATIGLSVTKEQAERLIEMKGNRHASQFFKYGRRLRY